MDKDILQKKIRRQGTKKIGRNGKTLIGDHPLGNITFNFNLYEVKNEYQIYRMIMKLLMLMQLMLEMLKNIW